MASGLSSLLRAFRHRNYRLFFFGQLISLVGTWMQAVAQSWLVYRLTGSSRWLGYTGFASQLPVLLLSPLGGVIADRLPRRAVLVATQTTAMLLAFTLALLTFTDRVSVGAVIALAAGLGVVNSVDIATRQSFVVEMVGREDLVNAIGLNSAMVNGARIVGPAMAGALVAWVGESWCFLANGVSYLFVIAGLLLMRVERRAPAATGQRVLGHIVDGFRFAGGASPVLAILLLVGVTSLCGVPYATLMPAFAEGVLHEGARGFGWLMGAAGVGALVGALTLAIKQGVAGLGRWVAVAGVLFGAALILFSRSHSYHLSLAALVPVGFGFMVELAAANTLLQTLTPDAMRGRVMALYAMMVMGVAPFGSLAAGEAAARIGPGLTVAVGGALCILASAAFYALLPSLRAEARHLADTGRLERVTPLDDA